jgi:hypothetical protein
MAGAGTVPALAAQGSVRESSTMALPSAAVPVTFIEPDKVVICKPTSPLIDSKPKRMPIASREAPSAAFL